MTLPYRDIEQEALDQIAPELIGKGYQVDREFDRQNLPEFFSGYVPDAIAVGQTPKIAIEIKTRSSPNVEKFLDAIRNRFSGRQDWKFQAYFFDPQTFAPEAVGPQHISEQSAKVEKLINTDVQAALLLAWATLEAAMRDQGLVQRTPSSLVGVLASEGIIEGDMVPRLFDIVKMRNQIAHGALTLVPAPEDVRVVLKVADQLLAKPEEAA